METHSSEKKLIRAIGTWGLAAGIINVTVGGGIFRLPASVAGPLGEWAPLVYLVCAVAMGLIVMCFAEAGSRVSLTGGPYAYVEVAFGPMAGFLSGVMLLILGTLAPAAVSTLFADAIGALVPSLAAPPARALLLVATFALLTGVNILGVKQGAQLNVVLTIAKLLPLLLLVAAGFFAWSPDTTPAGPFPESNDIARMSVLLLFAFCGVESALVPSGEVRDPAHTVPRAIFIAMLGITVLYISLHLVAQNALGGALASSPMPLADAASVVLGSWGRVLVLAGAAVSMFGYVSGMTLAIPRAVYAMARDGLLPSPLARVHERFHTPYLAIIVLSAIAAVLAITSGFERLAIMANLALMLLYVGCALAAIVLRRRGVQMGGLPFKVPAGHIMPYAALAVIFWILTSITLMEWAVMGAVIAVALLSYALARRRKVAAAS